MTKVYIIAEAGVNHNGSLEVAKRLVEKAAEAGADAVKFQTFFAKNLATSSAPKADYQKKATGDTGSQFEMLRCLELSKDAHLLLKAHALEYGIEFLSTPFGLEELDFLVHEVGVRALKMSSGEITNGPLLLSAARAGLPIILSTGMSNLQEITDALSVLAFGYTMGPAGTPSQSKLADAFHSEEGVRALREKVTILHCTTQYPTPLKDVNLRAMDTLVDNFGLQVGYSDHTEGIVTSVAAAARGACVLEKHFTLDCCMEGPDHAASIEPDDLGELVASVRDVEKLLGTADKGVGQQEAANLVIARKSLVAAKEIAAGEYFTMENLRAKRPGGGISPMAIWDVLGQKALRDYETDDQISIETIGA